MQLFSSLYSRLANVMTSNGFCYCDSVAACQVLHATTTNRECTLLETIRSLYDRKLRPVRILGGQAACNQQLDWPFEAGIMRDGMLNVGVNSSINNPACNVLNRLPPFKYRQVHVFIGLMN